MAASVTVALVHHPVVDKNGETIAAAVTALDLHDIARAAKTYGAAPFYVVTPLEDQQELVQSIIGHWVTGHGAKYNPDRQSALELIQLAPTLESVLADMQTHHGVSPKVVVTSARDNGSNLDFAQLRALADDRRPLLLVFGTAWGLAPELMASADYHLAPITGKGDYNHLSVRSAVSIILDRMLG